MGLLIYISYVAVLAAFAFVTLSLASGLLYASELIEEHSRLAKFYGQRGVYVIILLHVVLYFFDSLPFFQTAFSVMCHVVYLQNFSPSWPLISLSSPSFLASCVFVVLDHFFWFSYFSRVTQEARRMRTYRGPVPDVPGFTEIASFFGICVWLAPLFLFLSLSANDNALPVSAADPGTPSGLSSMQSVQTRTSLFRSLFSFNGLPKLRQKSRRDTAEGLLALHSPHLQEVSLPSPSPTTSRYGASPRSPGPKNSPELDTRSPPTGFMLSSPSRPIHRQALGTGSDASGLGLRRSNNVSAGRDI